MQQNVIDMQKDSNTADRVRVISMLYDGAINFLRTAEKKMESGDSAGKILYIRKTTAIIRELSGSLNMEGGEIAENLSKLYAFVMDCLQKADEKNDTKAVKDALKVIEILRDAWDEMQKVSVNDFEKAGPNLQER